MKIEHITLENLKIESKNVNFMQANKLSLSNCDITIESGTFATILSESTIDTNTINLMANSIAFNYPMPSCVSVE